MSHRDDNEGCPWNDPETFANPVTGGLPCCCDNDRNSTIGEPSPEDWARMRAAGIERRHYVLSYARASAELARHRKVVRARVDEKYWDASTRVNEIAATALVARLLVELTAARLDVQLMRVAYAVGCRDNMRAAQMAHVAELAAALGVDPGVPWDDMLEIVRSGKSATKLADPVVQNVEGRESESRPDPGEAGTP